VAEAGRTGDQPRAPAGLTAALTERLGELGRELVLSALAELRAGKREAAATMLTELVGR
jgi:hypothetical protein